MRAKRVSFIPKVLFRGKCNEFFGGRKQSPTTCGGEQDPKEGEIAASNADSRLQSTRNEVVGVSLSLYGQPPK